MKLERSAAALGDFADVIELLRGSTGDGGATRDPVSREQLARALYGRAFALDELGRQPESVVVFDELVAAYSAETCSIVDG